MMLNYAVIPLIESVKQVTGTEVWIFELGSTGIYRSTITF